MNRIRRMTAWTLGSALLPVAAAAQGYQLRLDTRWQAVAYRGVMLDSIAVGDTVPRAGSGPFSPDGFAVQCRAGVAYCMFFRPGDTVRAAPLTTTASLTAWGVGLPGLSVHAVGRLGVDLGDGAAWPGTEPAGQLLTGYAEYSVPRWTGRLGRQVIESRLGSVAFDGATLLARDARTGLELQGYAGWGLARGAALPVTSPALNPLDDFQPRRRQLVAGAGAAWHRAPGDVRIDYLREVDPRSDYFVSERIGLQGALRPLDGMTLSAGADYDMAAGWWGSAEASLAYAHRLGYARLSARRYRPHFELWTIWGVFSPVPYRSLEAFVTVTAVPEVQVRARYERYDFDNSETSTPLFNAEEDGWRWEVATTLTPVAAWSLDASYRQDFGPGAGVAAAAASVTYAPSPRLSVTALASNFSRPLEFRFSEAVVHAYGVDAVAEPRARVQVGLSVMRYTQSHLRPDAGAFDWNQIRAAARVALLLGGADGSRVPPAIRLLPGDRSAR